MRACVTFHRFSPAARRRLLPLSAIVYVSLLMSASALFSQVPIRKNILIINEVGLTYPASALITQQIMSQLASSSTYRTEFYVESLDSTSFADEASQRNVEDLLVEKYRDRNLDVIVAMGPAPIRFLTGFSKKFLPDVPVVFCGSTQEQAGNPDLGSRFTGSWMKLEPAKTLDVALQLSPETKHIAIVGGSSAFDRGVLAITRARLDKYPVALDFIYLTDLEMGSLLERLRHLPPKTVVLYVSFFRDAAGSPFTNATVALPLVSQAANAPVFGMSDTYIGHGVVGGNVMSFAEQGKIAARMVSEIFRGRRAQDIPTERGSDFYMFDWTQLRRWGLSDNTLPAGSVVLYRERTLWQRAKWMLIAAFLLILGLASVALYLLFKEKQLRLAKTEQMRLSDFQLPISLSGRCGRRLLAKSVRPQVVHLCSRVGGC